MKLIRCERCVIYRGKKGRLRERRQKSRGGFKTDQRTDTEDEFHSVIYKYRPRLVVVGTRIFY